MQRTKTISVLLATDANYALPVAVAGRSIAWNLAPGYSLECFVLDLGLDAASRQAIESSWPDAKATFITVPAELLADLPLSNHSHAGRLTVSIYGYLHVPALLADRCERLLYLDADTLAIADVGPLWEADLGGAPFAAVQDCFVKYVTAHQNLPDVESLGVDDTTKYFNSGMLLIDLAAWIKERITERCLDFARCHGALDFPDQDCLNATAHGLWHEVGQEWNFQVDRAFIAEYRGPTPKILHYGGLRKPWTVGSIIPHYQAMYVAYQQLTPFAQYPPVPPATR